MKYFTIPVPLSLALCMAMVFFSCSSISEKPLEDEYFVPVDKVVHQKEGDGSYLHVFTRERRAVSADDSMKKIVIGMLQEQNKQLDEVVQKLNSLTMRERADTLRGTKNLRDLLATRDRISNEMLLEMIREQNQRLDDVIEQLKFISEKQQLANLARVERVSAQEPPAPLISSVESLDASLKYGKALRLYQNRQYKKAIHSFRTLLQRGMNVSLQDNCHFWMGVCYFHLNRTNQAMGEFTEVLKISDSDKREGAYFMIGQCYEQVGARQYAEVTFEKMLEEYPRGSLKQVGEIKLALLK